MDVSQVGRGVDEDGTLNVDIIISGQVPEIDRDASIDLLPYSELYIQTGPGTYSHVRVSVCLSVCGQVTEIDRDASIDTDAGIYLLSHSVLGRWI